MTTVWIAHNPFLVETEIIIDDIPIAETSRLYKYIKTPMQNWVGSFLPTLVEHCNDDELNITFKGLQHNYEDLESELNTFLAKNRDYEIQLHFDACQSQIERLEILNTIREKVARQLLVPELPSPSDPKPLQDSLTVLVMGRNDTQRRSLMESLSEDSSVNARFFPLSISGLDSGYEAVEQAVNSDKKPILICLLDENTGSKANAKIMTMISDSYRVRSKFHKWRFIFVADNPQYAKRLLSSDFAIKNTDVFASDDISSIFQRIDEYRNEVCLIRCVTDLTDNLAQNLSQLKQRLDTRAEQDKKMAEINGLEQSALDIVDNCSLDLAVSTEDCIETFIEQLNCSFLEHCCLKPDSSMQITEIATIECVKNFVRDILPEMIRAHLQSLAKSVGYSIKFDTQKLASDCSINTVKNTLQQFGCNSLLYFVTEYVEPKKLPIPINSIPTVEEYLEKVSKLTTPVSVYSFQWYSDFIQLANDYGGRHNGSEIIFDYYNGLCALVCKYLSSTSPMNASMKMHCSTVFKKQIARVKPILQLFLQLCNSSAASECRKVQMEFKEILHDTKEEITLKASKMRQNAQISAEQEAQLEFNQQLLEQTEALTRL